MKNQLVVKSCVLCECFLSLTQSMIAHSHFFITNLCITLTNPWLIVNDCPNHKPIVQITNPWLICDCPQISHRPSPQWPKASKPWRPTAGNGPTATHVIWTPPTASHDHHRPTAIWIPCQFEAYKSILRERRSFHCERKRGESVGEREVKRKRKSPGGRESVIKKWTFSLQSHEQWGCIYATSL